MFCVYLKRELFKNCKISRRILKPLNSKKTGTDTSLCQASRLSEADIGAAMQAKNTRGKKSYRAFIFHGQLILTNMQSYRHCPPLAKEKKENCQKIRNLDEVFHNRLHVLSRRGLG